MYDLVSDPLALIDLCSRVCYQTFAHLVCAIVAHIVPLAQPRQHAPCSQACNCERLVPSGLLFGKGRLRASQIDVGCEPHQSCSTQSTISVCVFVTSNPPTTTLAHRPFSSCRMAYSIDLSISVVFAYTRDPCSLKIQVHPKSHSILGTRHDNITRNADQKLI